MREDHQLPIFLEYQQNYSRNLPRLAKEVLKKYHGLSMIDIGANIGDTVALVRSLCNFPITCIEGDSEFFGILQSNIKQFKDVAAYKCLLGDENTKINADLKKNVETARLKNNSVISTSSGLEIVTLDKFIDSHRDVGKAKLIKIDTDGYDMKILKGGFEYIKTSKPIIFLEYDPIYFAEQGESGTVMLSKLENIGYSDIIFYDNFGRLIISCKLNDHLQIKQMNNCVDINLRIPFSYYDIAIFHKEDEDLAKTFIESEMRFFYSDNRYAQ